MDIFLHCDGYNLGEWPEDFPIPHKGDAVILTRFGRAQTFWVSLVRYSPEDKWVDIEVKENP